MRYGYRLAGGVARHNVEQSVLWASILDDVDERLELSDHVAEDEGWKLKTFLCTALLEKAFAQLARCDSLPSERNPLVVENTGLFVLWVEE